MKKLFFTLLFTVFTLFNTGCTNTKELEQQISNLQLENEKLKSQLKNYETRELEEKKEKERIEKEKSKNKEIKLNELIVVEGYGEFLVKSTKLTQKVVPPNPDSFYSYYEVKDPNEIYLDVIMDFKNTTTIGIGTDEITNVKVIYDGQYEYSSFSALEESGGSDFTYTNINTVEPLKTITLHHLATLPLEVKNSEKPLEIQFSVYGSNYVLKIR